MNKYRTILIVIIIAYFFLFFFFGMFRHWGFLTTFVDLAKYDREILNVIETGRLFSTYHVHFDPIHLIFVPFYLIYPTVAWIVAAQAMAVSMAAWIIFLLAARIFESERIGLTWALIFLVNPFLLNAAAWDVDTITLAVPFVALGFLALDSRNFKIMLFAVLFILACKQHLGLMIFGFGILWWITNRQWKHGVALMTIGLGYFFLVLQVIMPALSPSGQIVMMSESSGTASRYAWLGNSLVEVIQTIITQPISILETVLISMGGLGYLLLLLIPFLFFPLLGLIYLLPGMADLAANMLSANPMPRSPIAYHSAALIPIFTVAAIYGVKTLSKWQKRFSVKELSVLVLIASALMGYVFAPFPIPGAANVWAPASFVSLPDPRVQEIRSLVGKDASVSVQNNIGAHFSQNKEIYRYPSRIDLVDVVILRLESPTKNIHNYPEERKETRRFIIGMLDNHLQMDREDYLSSVEELLLGEEFGVIYWDNPWLVLKRGDADHENISDIMKKLRELKLKWL